MKKITGIRKRWMVNSISVVLFIVLLAVAAFSAAMGSYYYSTLSESLKQKAENAISSFDYYRTEAEYYDNARAVVAGEPNSDKLEVEYLDADGQIRFSSSDLTAFRSPGTPDIAEAISMKRTKVWIGADPSTGEHIMAASSPLMIDGEVVGVMRYVTSLNKVDKQIIIIVAIALGIGLGILGMVYFSNLYFIRSIVDPVAGITETAKRIAAGSYGVQIEKRYDDEIGALTDTINDMSLKINQSEKMKNEFISSVSHELRTPLTAINGWAETIMNGEVRDAGDVKKGMGIIVSEARRLTNMVEELLEFSRIQDGRFTLSVEPMDIKAELEDAVYTYREFFRREGIELNHFDCDEEFPPIAGDPERLRQVFCNLLDNAAKHGGSGKRIDTAIARDEDQVVITIRDYGPGIPAEELPHVKYKFYKGSSKARGSGIGLAVCDEIITRHEGTLDIDNAEGGGCIVTIHLPIRAQAAIEQKF
ncbi:sensor histidine kinase [Flavonifractor plautii]|jgi:signal transduction histidine kinase|uniref:sensor histidine kinase n=1 Tax=Flavonifractor plautii TaxID=292800 RepID=UPI0006C7A1B5|nr:HAMP domain-containing sensor histidine kinase [Flavonifractor plautii]MBM6791202.1 HAMP domain-containing histidine kinase [Flavonifractor plautii]MCB5582180.1 HAMP domain-containing histidine kinase [Flavonifractor plautii]MCR1920070.1 HAMP domain-containing histidine kinase [Flavonifractor plautii]MDU3013698.1 HAMP domain-containing sensor histidine kinase [Flavonifractor plautii]MEE0192528.1 HAMP domain-containing sensor histidine kinase [Flavonifractor plautii]